MYKMKQTILLDALETILGRSHFGDPSDPQHKSPGDDPRQKPQVVTLLLFDLCFCLATSCII